ncbi:Eco57I restriction-modification methylase domain-containing protein [Bacillus cereus group sp. Bc177]|uniref:Eco57I restriction-modification methylase domain-containing protein n=1 Tax=Bacillus cereus group sp. Bc177 TaxID=3018114 RepID=UPI0022E10EC1|nr:Eco57I restriction-modification methylase domain-containing protein [Bacillus cereus group sp. Bc177]MDA2322659.1 Eco57I restriction-modification methylase domain-containing protein [Bacillus cereus group sp. Bc177]
MVIDFLDSINKSSSLTTSSRTRSLNKEINEQYFTPMPIASFMSSMFTPIKKNVINFMDAGAGVGNLSASFIATICNWEKRPKKIKALLYEIDMTLLPDLRKNMELCIELCRKNNIDLEIVIKNEDFIESSVECSKSGRDIELLDYVILNPPYKKMNTDSRHKKLILEVGIDVPNYYAAFVALSYRLLDKKAQLVCIIPRSFCNGQYFKAFRKDLINNNKIEKLHIFESRKDIFEDDVLQETLIMFLTKNKQKMTDYIEITGSIKDDFSEIEKVRKRFDNVIFPTDSEKVIRIIRDNDNTIVEQMHSLSCTLADLNISVSTGPVVDFREKKELLSYEGNIWSLPIIYPENFENGFVQWPIIGRKPGFIFEDESNFKRLREPGIYVLVKRMSSKEEQKRIVAAVYDSQQISRTKVAFDNKVNYYHINNMGLNNRELAKGLSLYLNSSLVDFYFRTFSGSTQVNVSDLKVLRYPSIEQLEILGESYEGELPSQDEIDTIINEVLIK